MACGDVSTESHWNSADLGRTSLSGTSSKLEGAVRGSIGKDK